MCSTWDCSRGQAAAPDPYVRERQRVYRTITLANTYSPEWNEVVDTGFTVEQLMRPFVFELLDDDSSPFNGNDPIATFEVQLRPEQIAAGRIEFRAPVGGSQATLVLEVR